MTNAWVREDTNNRTIVFLENKETSKRYFWNTIFKRFTTLCFALVVLLSLINTREENTGQRQQIRELQSELVCRSAASAGVDAATARIILTIGEGLVKANNGESLDETYVELSQASHDLEIAIVTRDESLTKCTVD